MVNCIKKTLNAGRGKLIDWRDGTKAVFHYQTLMPIEPINKASGMPEDRTDYKCIDDTRKPWPDGYGKPLELVFGKKFQLPIFETCLRSMLLDEISQFDVDIVELGQYPFVSKKLRDISKPNCASSHTTTHMCAASMASGTGYEQLDELLKNPRPLRFIFHLLQVYAPEDYEAERWQLNDSQKLLSVDDYRLDGNKLFQNKQYHEAIEKYREALTRLETLVLREKPGEPEWIELDQKNVALYSNLSQCYLSVKEYHDAEETSTEVLNRDAKNEKALFRRAKARIALWKLDEALEDLQLLEKINPSLQTLCENEKRILEDKRKEKLKDTKDYCSKMFK